MRRVQLIGLIGVLTFLCCWLWTRPASAEELPPSARTVTTLGHLSGAIRKMLPVEPLLYLLQGPGLSIVDVSDPAAPVRLGSIQLDPYPRDFVVVGSYAYVVGGHAGLQIIDLSAPQAPVLVGRTVLATYTQNIAVAGDYAYVTYLNESTYTGGIYIVDIAVPTNPTLAADIPIAEYNVSQLLIRDTTLYVTGSKSRGDLLWSGHFQIFSLASPLTPMLLGSYTDPTQQIYIMDVVGDSVYLWNEGTLLIMDGSDPAKPAELSRYTPVHGLGSFIIHGQYAYLGYNSEPQGGEILDLSKPGAPQKVGHFGNGFLLHLAATDAHLFFLQVIGQEEWGVQIASLADPTTPQVVGIYKTLDTGLSAVAATNAYAYVDGYFSFVSIIDIRNPANMDVVGNYQSIVISAQQLIVDQDRLFILGYGYNDGVEIADITIPTSPQRLSYTAIEDERLLGMLLVEDRLYISFDTPRDTLERDSGIHVLDVSDPAHPTEIATIKVRGGDNAQPIDVVDNLLYVASTYYEGGSSWLHRRYAVTIYNIDTSAEIALYPLQKEPGSLQVDGNWLYVSYYPSHNESCRRQVDVLNVADPAHPQLAGSFCGWPWGTFRIEDGYAYIAGGNDGLRIWDLTLPWAIAEIGSYADAMGASDIALHGDRILVADWTGTLYALRFRPPQTSIQVAQHATQERTADDIVYTFIAETFTTTGTLTHTPRAVDHQRMLSDTLTIVGNVFANQVLAVENGQSLQATHPYTITIPYSDEDLGLVDESTLALYRWDRQSWVRENSSVDLEANRVRATPRAFGLWALAGNSYRHFLPLIAFPP